jgi:hypothetical protein
MPEPPDKMVDAYYVYPNPAGNQVNIRYRLGAGQSEVKLLVLNMAGEPVMDELDGPALAGMDNEQVVGLTGVAPGMYVVRLKVTTGGRSEVRFAKLAIVR